MAINLMRIKHYLQNFFSLSIVVGLGVYIWQNIDAFASALYTMESKIIFLLSVCIILSWIANALPIMIFMRLFGKKIGFFENYFVMMGAALGNYLPMRVGTIVRMRYFKHVLGLEYSAFCSIFGVKLVLLLFGTGFFGCVALLGLSLDRQIPLAPWLLFASVLVCSLLSLFLPLPRMEGKTGFLSRLVTHLSSAQRDIGRNLNAFALLQLCILFQFAMIGVRLHLSFLVFGIEDSIWAYFLIGPVAALSTFVNITPGNLGVREWLIGVLATLGGFDFQSAVFAGTLDRGLMLILTFLFGGTGLMYALRKTGLAIRNTDSVAVGTSYPHRD